MQVVLSLDPGGTERLVIDLAKRLHTRHGMAICCLDGPGAWASELGDVGVPVTALNRKPGFDLRLARRVAHLSRRHQALVLHCHHYSPFVYGALARLFVPVRVIYTEHGRLSDGPPSQKRRLANAVLSRVPSGVYAVSENLKGHMLREGFSSTRVHVVSNGVSAAPRADLRAKSVARRLLGISGDQFVVGAVGRLDPVKDLPTLISGFGRFTEMGGKGQLLLIGEGSERLALERLIEEAGLSRVVTLLGHRGDVSTVLPALDVYVNSSIFEGISLTILEAMAAGLPIVATRVGGTPEVVVHEETGWLVPPRAPHAIAEALRRLEADPVRRSALGAAARSRFERHFSIETMVDRYSAIYDSFEVR